jgi:hypothetical protein
MLDHREFKDRAAADLFYDSVEDGHQYVSLKWTGAVWLVSFGTLQDPRSDVELLAEMYDKEEAEGNAALHDDCEARAAAEVAAEAAKEAGLTDDAAKYFAYGFQRTDIKQVNPRAVGFEREFRQGKAARQVETWRRKVASRTSHIYHNTPKYQVRPVIYGDCGDD